MPTADVRTYARDKVALEVGALERLGVEIEGNACSEVLVVKGEPGEAELAGATLLAGADGRALRAALSRLGYPPEAWLAMATWDERGRDLAPDVVRLAVVTLAPGTVVALDEHAADALRHAFADDAPAMAGSSEPTLTPGVVTCVSGMRMMNLAGFEAALASPRDKQVMWARLKLVPPEADPY